jgi:uncharacterized protein with PQ loop repeat
MENFFLNYVTIFGTAFLIIFYIIQIGKTIKSKTAKGISWMGWSCLNLALICMFANALTIYLKFGTWGYLLTETANVVLALIELTLILKYRKKD